MSDLLRRTLGEQISVETVLRGGLWRTYADPSQLENAVLNLAVNARDAIVAAGSESGRLTIETNNAHLDDEYARSRAEVEPGQYVLICVSDTGAGMTPGGRRARLRSVLHHQGGRQGHRPRAQPGVRLRQAIGRPCRDLFGARRRHDGEALSAALHRPARRGSAAAEARRSTIPEGRADEIILVVEDEQRVRHFSVDALRELGYTAISAGDGREALRAARREPVDLPAVHRCRDAGDERPPPRRRGARAAARRSRCSTPPATRATPSSTTACSMPASPSCPSPSRSSSSPARCAK